MGSTEPYTFDLTTIRLIMIELLILFMMVSCCSSCKPCRCKNPNSESSEGKYHHWGTPLFQCTTRRSCFVACDSSCKDLFETTEKSKNGTVLCRSRRACVA